MCSHCREFEDTVFLKLKANYIDTNIIHFIFREVLAPVDPQRVIPTIALAEYQVARCNNATPEQYFSRLGVMFEQQPAMYQAGSRQGIESKLVEIGGAAGLSRDVVTACIADPAGSERMTRLGELATRDGVTGTPTFFLNGQKIDDPSIMTYDGMAAALDAAIAARG
jgi:protein-disulfide isomerase